MSIKQTVITEIEISYDTTASEVKRWLEKIPETAKISTRHVKGDRPFDSSQDFIKAMWTDETGRFLA